MNTLLVRLQPAEDTSAVHLHVVAARLLPRLPSHQAPWRCVALPPTTRGTATPQATPLPHHSAQHPVQNHTSAHHSVQCSPSDHAF